MFDVTIDPSIDPTLYHFMLSMVGFDSVDDESILESNKFDVLPEDWTFDNEPCYNYWMYFMWANI